MAAVVFRFADDGSAAVFEADGRTLVREHSALSGVPVGKKIETETPRGVESASNPNPNPNPNPIPTEAAAILEYQKLKSRPFPKIAGITDNVTSGAAALRRRVSTAADFVVNGAPRARASATPVSPSAQTWIDAWAAGAPSLDLRAIKASREAARASGDQEQAIRDEDGVDVDEKRPEPEIETKKETPVLFDLSDVDLTGPTPGSADPAGRDPDAREYPDSVFVSDDEDDQKAMEGILGTPRAKVSASESAAAALEADAVFRNASGTKTRRAAFFDLDGTVAASNVVFQYVAWKMHALSGIQKLFWVPFYALKCVLYVLVDSISRSAFNALFAKDFKGLSAAESSKRAMAEISHETYTRDTIFPAAVRAIGALKAQGFEIVLVTGSFDFMIEPVAKLIGADFVIANRLAAETCAKTNESRFTGELASPAVADEEKRVRILQYAEANDIDLQASRAYGDAVADEAMLRTVGSPSVVSPKAKMRRKAVQEGWPILEWSA
jgi:HAD superfamily hydrolase (TIGR01490 family)